MARPGPSAMHLTLAELLDESQPRFSHPHVVDARIQHAIQALENDPTGKPNTSKTATKFRVPVEPFRLAWKEHKAKDRLLTAPQEKLLCQRLDRLTRYGGKAKAREEPTSAEDLVEKYACGVLQLLEHNDPRIIYTLQSHWVSDFLARHPEYGVLHNGPSAPEHSTHPQTNARDTWLTDEQKTLLHDICQKHYPLRGNKSVEEHWKAVKSSAKKEIGFDFWWMGAKNEGLQRKHRPDTNEGTGDRVLGKRKRGEDGEHGELRWSVFDAACTNFLDVDMSSGLVQPPHCSPPPGLERLEEDEEPERQFDFNALFDHTLPANTRYTQPRAANPITSTVNHTDFLHMFDYEPYAPAPPAPAPPPTLYGSEDEDPQTLASNAIGLLSQSPKPNAAATARAYNLPERLLQDRWNPRRRRPAIVAARLMADQEARLLQRLRRLVCFGGEVMVLGVEDLGSDAGREKAVRVYANGVLAEDDLLVDGNMVIRADWAAEFLKRHQGFGMM